MARKIARNNKGEKRYGEKVNNGATKEEIAMFLEEAKARLRADFPGDYVKILEQVNGLEFNGFILYGIDQYLLSKQPNQSINGLIENNKYWYENEWLQEYIFIGESGISWYAYHLTEGEYVELDSPSGEKIEEFSNLACMVERVLSEALE